MVYRLPLDIEDELQKKYPDIHVKSFVDKIFKEILDKTFKDGACTIKGVGKFISFVTHSKRIGGKTVRFKFRPSQALTLSIRNDEYLLKNLPVHAQVPFTENNEKYCNENKDQKYANAKAIDESAKHATKKLKEHKTYQEVLNIVQRGDNDKKKSIF